MDEATIIQFLTTNLADVQTETIPGGTFFFHGTERQMPFATLVTTDAFDRASALDRPGVFRLNAGIGRETCHALFGAAAPRPEADGVVDPGQDFTALDVVMPHPVYAPMFWVCVLNPGEATFTEVVRPLLVEAHARAAKRGSAE